MSVHVTSWVYDHAPRDLKPSEMLVALVMADHANGEGGFSFPSIARIAQMSRLGESTVRSALSELCDLGVLQLSKEATNKMPATYRFPHFSRGAGSGGPESGTQEPRGAGSGTPGVQDLESRGAGSAPEPYVNRNENQRDTPPLPPNEENDERETPSRGAVVTREDLDRLRPGEFGQGSQQAPQAQGTQPRAQIGSPPSSAAPPSNGLARELANEYWDVPERKKAFDHFYGMYPKQSPVIEAMIMWRINIPAEVADNRQAMTRIYHGLQWWLGKWKQEGTELQWIPKFSRWLERKQWEQAKV